MGSQNRIFAAEFHELSQCLCLFWRTLHHSICNAGEFDDLCRDRPLRVYHGVEGFHHLHSTHPDSADFGQPVMSRAESCRFHVKYNDLIL